MPRWDTIHFVDGDFVKMRSPSLKKTAIIRQYHLELLNQLQTNQISIYPFSETIEMQIYEIFRIYYQKVANQMEIEENYSPNSPNYLMIYSSQRKELVPVVNCDRILSLSRHNFFICTDPIQHPTSGEWIVGLAGLSQLMGYSYLEGDGEEPKHTTGDSELDIEVDTYLMFKKNARALLWEHGVEDLAKIIVQANHRLTPPDDEKDKDGKKVASLASLADIAPDDEVFEENKEAITQGLVALRVELPEGW